MDKKKLYENILNPAVRQALVWGGSGLLAHHASRVADSHHKKELHKIKGTTPDFTKKNTPEAKLERKKSLMKGVAATVSAAGAGYLGSKL